MSKQYPLLMTATIDTKGMVDLSISDMGVRESQYLETFSFYLERGWLDEIVFIENSGYDLGRFHELARLHQGTRIEFISCNLND